jgi:hypothetical protein
VIWGIHRSVELKATRRARPLVQLFCVPLVLRDSRSKLTNCKSQTLWRLRCFAAWSDFSSQELVRMECGMRSMQNNFTIVPLINVDIRMEFHAWKLSNGLWSYGMCELQRGSNAWASSDNQHMPWQHLIMKLFLSIYKKRTFVWLFGTKHCFYLRG